MPTIPMREDQLARQRSRKGGDQQAVKRGVARPVGQVEPDPEWHPVARMLWDGALTSGQSDFYQNSDYAVLYFLCGQLDSFARTKGYLAQRKTPSGEVVIGEDGEPVEYFVPPRLNAQLLSVMEKMMGNLLLTEGDRRRVRVELTEPEGQSEAEVAELDRRRQQRERLKGKAKT